MAQAAGYPKVVSAHSLTEMETAIADFKAEPQLTFLNLKIKKGSKKNLGRPKKSPSFVAKRFKEFLK